MREAYCTNCGSTFTLAKLAEGFVALAQPGYCANCKGWHIVGKTTPCGGYCEDDTGCQVTDCMLNTESEVL